MHRYHHFYHNWHEYKCRAHVQLCVQSMMILLYPYRVSDGVASKFFFFSWTTTGMNSSSIRKTFSRSPATTLLAVTRYSSSSLVLCTTAVCCKQKTVYYTTPHASVYLYSFASAWDPDISKQSGPAALCIISHTTYNVIQPWYTRPDTAAVQVHTIHT